MGLQKSQRYCRWAGIVVGMVVGLFAVAGCSGPSLPQGDPLAVGPDVDSLDKRSAFSDVAIEAAGGLDAWVRTRRIDLDCVVTFYQEDGDSYLTEQLYEIFPWSNAIRISGVEPSGGYSWLLQEGRFSISQGTDRYAGLSVGVDNGCIAEGILSVMTAPARLLDKAMEFNWSSELVTVKRQLYKPIARTPIAGVPGGADLRETSFYQKETTGRVDMVVLKCRVGGGVLVVRGHGYQLLGLDGVMVPSRIEVFKADASGRVRHRIILIDLK